MTTRYGRPLSIRIVTKSLAKLDLAIAVLLSVYGVYLVSGLVHGNTKHSGPFAAVMVLFMTLPVAWRRRAPVAVAAVLAAGAVVNPILVGDMIRCGPALPALLLCAYSVGSQPARLGRLATGSALACLLLSATVQTFTDPNLNPGVMVAMGPLILGLCGVGRLVESRTRLAAELEQRNQELRRQRERRAELAVQADRVRIAEGLDVSLNAQITEMRAAAARGRQALDEEHSVEAAQQAFETIQQRGRETLTHMRRVVGTLLEGDPRPMAPQPSLSQLDPLVARAGSGDVHLHVTGVPKVLPGVVELSAYRTLEYLLDAYGDLPGQRIDIEVDYAAEALSLTVRGPVPASVAIESALASIRARVDVHQGALSTSFPEAQWETNVRLPLESGA
jgi:signal transduction histidine kinase